jgi:TetR/AcrR family transcriptional repressor of nem operon
MNDGHHPVNHDDEYNPDCQANRKIVGMGHSKVEKADSHERIVRIAAARFREVGLEGIGVADLMREAGLTHGGFYRHFGSRDDLVLEAVERALLDGGRSAFEAEQNASISKTALLFALVDWYLSTAHRDELATSCAVTSLAADVSRSTGSVRSAYTRQVNAYLELFVRLMPANDRRSNRLKAIGAWSAMVGAVSMARAVNDEALSSEILRVAAAEVKNRLR